MSYHTSAPRQTTTTTSTQVKIAPVGYHYMPDGTLMLNSEMNTDEYDVDYEGQKVITNFDMDFSTILASGGVRRFFVVGVNGSEFELEIKNEDNAYYNFYTNVFQEEQSSLKGKVTNVGSFSGSIFFPSVTDDDNYSIRLIALGETKHSKYAEVRFADESVDINKSTGSNSLLLKKIVYQVTDLSLVFSNYSSGANIPGTTVAAASIVVSTGQALTSPVSFSTTFTCANDKALRIIKQPEHTDAQAYVTPTIGAAPLKIDGENIYPAITTASDSTSSAGTTVNGASTGTTVTTHVVSSTIATVGDRVTNTSLLAGHDLNDATVIVTAVSEAPGKTFTINQAISIADDLPLTFSNQMNYRWPIDDFAHVLRPSFSFVPTTNLVAGSVLAKYTDSVTSGSGTEFEKTFINREYEAVDTIGLKPTITNGEVTAQAGAIVFDRQQPLALAGASVKAGGYGQKEILRVSGYELVFSDLSIALTPVTTTTTAAVNNSTSVPVASRNGILDDVSTVSGIGIAAGVVDPTVDTGAGAVSGAGTLVLTAAQTLEDDAVLTFANAGLVATITGSVQVLNVGTASRTIFFDLNNLISIT